MIAAEILKCVVVLGKNKETILMAVARYDNDFLNLKIEYDFDNLDVDQFFKDLKERLAQDFDIPTQRVSINERMVLDKMREFSLWQQGVVV